MRTFRQYLAQSLVVSLVVAGSSFAAEPANEPIARMSGNAATIDWQSPVDHEQLLLTVTGPDGRYYQKQFPSGTPAAFRVADLPKIATEGTYVYDLRVVPRISADVKRRLAAARAAGDDAEILNLQQQAGVNRTIVQSGAFTYRSGTFISTNVAELDANDARTAAPSTTGGMAITSAGSTSAGKFGAPVANDQVIPDDLIVQGSACVGLDCVNNETFGFDTLRLKENNLRINFDDTSTSTGFPSMDWRLIANDSPSGGANKFSIEDSTTPSTPFTIIGGAPTDSLFVSSTGRVGFRTSTPALDLHMRNGNTPAVRFEQDATGGFTAQTWDIGANEANFFVRDLTGGSRLPFRIRPGAPTSSIDISASGNVGINTTSPSGKLQIHDTVQNASRVTLSGQEFFQPGWSDTNGVALLVGVNRANNRQLWIADSASLAQNSTNGIIRLSPNGGDVSAMKTDGSAADMVINRRGGNVGFGIQPSFPIHHVNGAYLSAGGVWTNASSRELKQNITSLGTEEAMSTLENLAPVTYTYKAAPNEHHVGFIAEDVPQLVATPDRKGLSSMDVVAVLTKVAQEQQKTIEQLSSHVQELTQRINQLEQEKQQH